MSNLDGDDFCDIFAESIGGVSHGRPVGVADVTWNGCCWSVKTIKNSSPHKFFVRKNKGQTSKRIRLIIGRNSPSYSSNIENPFEDLAATGKSVLNIYNSRISEASQDHTDLRLLVLIRHWERQEFTIFEKPITQYAVNDYTWSRNKNDNLEAYKGNEHVFTWQPHGSQLTLVIPVPESATRFRLTKNIPPLDMNDVLQQVGFDPNWVQVVSG